MYGASINSKLSRIDERKGSNMNIFKKIFRAMYYAMITWAITLILCGFPFIKELSEIWPWITMAVMAIVVESLFGTSPRIVLELIIDMGIGAICVLVHQFLTDLPLFQDLSSQFSIPRMDVLVIFIVVAFVSQLEVRSKREKRSRRPIREDD